MSEHLLGMSKLSKSSNIQLPDEREHLTSCSELLLVPSRAPAFADHCPTQAVYDPAQKARCYQCFCRAVSHYSHRMPGTGRQPWSHANTNTGGHSCRLTPKRESHYLHDAGEPIFRRLLWKD